jgi:hypothetical protein
MNPTVAIGWPGPLEMGLLALIALAIPAAIIVMVMWACGRRSVPPAFPVMPAFADGPGTYLVAGVDKNTRADRQTEYDAQSRANAVVKAELDGVIVTSITKRG